MGSEIVLKKIKHQWHGSLKSYLIGFALSLLLTSIAFFFALDGNLTGINFLFPILGLGFLQVIAQLLFFLHVGAERKPRYGLIALYFTILILFIVIVGSLWVMQDLNERMMPHMIMEIPK